MGGTLAITVALCGLFTAFVDPLGVIGSPRIAGVNAVKPLLDHHRELSRWRAAERMCPGAGIFGNSRAEIGFDPEHPAFAARSIDAFNHAIPGTGISMSLRQLRWLERAGCAPKLVVLGVEFFDFLGGDAPRADTLADFPAPSLDAMTLAETVFSLTALRDAIATLALQYASHPAQTTPRGFNPLLHYEAEVARSGHSVMFRQRAQENLKSWTRKPRRLAPLGGGPLADAVALDAFLAAVTARADEVHLVIYPYHAQIRLMIERAGLAPLYEQWKRDMLAAATRASHGGARVQLWDFSAIGEETLEAIPAPGDKRTRLVYYWEAGHFKKSLGDRMLAQMLQGRPGFGASLRQDMLDPWMQRDRERAAQLISTPSPLREEVDLLFQRH